MIKRSIITQSVEIAILHRLYKCELINLLQLATSGSHQTLPHEETRRTY